jgi:hypothetical protein
MPTKTSAIVLAVATLALSSCGSSSHSIQPRNAAGVRARLYAFYKAERADNTTAACAMATKTNQAELIAEEHVSSCQAAFFKIWNTTAGVLSEATEAQIGTKATQADQVEVAKAKILVVRNHATVIDPGRDETEEYIYSEGRWLFVKQEKNTESTQGLRQQAEETEAKNEAALDAGEAQATRSEITEAVEGTG